MGEHIDLDIPKEQSAEWHELEKLVGSLVKEQKPARLHLINEIFRVAVKLAKESPGTLNLKIVASCLKELKFSFKMFYPDRQIPKITIFGSARTPADSPLYAFTKDFAKRAVQANYMIITGGGPGIMAAGNEGAGEKGFGLNIRLPFEQSANPFISTEKRLINYKYFFTRKLFLVKEASAFAFFPGGFGTFDEAFEVLTLLQTGKSNLIPVTLMEPKGFGFWAAFVKFIETEVIPRGFISPQDLSLFRICNTADEAIAHFNHFYSCYHSMRFVKEKVVVRMKKKLSPKSLEELSKQFAKLSLTGKFEQTGPLPEEGNEPEIKGLTRLVFPSERKDFAMLRRLIDFLNDHSA